MVSLKEMDRRTDIQALSNFLIDGSSLETDDEGSYYERLHLRYEALENAFEEYIPDSNARSKIHELISEYTCAIESVYHELGLRCGAKLTANLLAGEPNERIF